MVDCSRYFGTRIFHSVVVVVESYEYPNFALKYGNSRFPMALGSYPEYLYDNTVYNDIVYDNAAYYNTGAS